MPPTYTAGVHEVSNKFRSLLKILGARREKRSEFHTEDTNSSRYRAKSSDHGELAPGICASLL
jgi:hypothetical protein